MAGLAALGLSSLLAAQTGGDRPLLQDSFRIGSGGGALCQAQSLNGDPAIGTMFDRAWAVVCRDAARPIGHIYALRESGGSDEALLAKLAASRGETVNCSAAGGARFHALGDATVRNCSGRSGTYRILSIMHGKTLYIAQGLPMPASSTLTCALWLKDARRPGRSTS